MKKWSGAATGLVVLTGNHMSVCGKNFRQVTDKVKDELDIYKEYDKDVIVEEDVWIGAHVTLLSGVTIGLGSVIGTGCVVRCNVPPYAIFAGNPAKVVGFRFTPEEVIKHEQILYSEEERLPIDVLTKNYKKYFLDHIKGIKDYTSIICR